MDDLERRARQMAGEDRRSTHRRRLEGDPHHAQLLEVRSRERSDADAAIGLGLDESLTLEHPQRFASRRAADPELVSEDDLGHHRPRGELAVEDRRPDPVVDGVVACLCRVNRLSLGPRRPLYAVYLTVYTGDGPISGTRMS
jgi:hypothetical protein